jgi:tetratricopeptide (TPR) repeat protein
VAVCVRPTSVLNSKGLLALLLCLVASRLSAAPGPSAEAVRADARYKASFYYSASLIADGKGSMAEGAAFLKLAADSDTTSAYLREALLRRYQLMGMSKEARGLMEQAASEDPEDAEAILRLAQSEALAERYDSAKAAYLKALALKGEDPDILRALSAVALAQHDTQACIAYAERCQKARPDQPTGRLLKAQALNRAERFEEAMQEWQAAQKAFPESDAPALQMGLSLEARDQGPEAIEVYCRGLDARANSLALHEALAHALYRQGSYEDALYSFELLAKADDEDQGARLYGGLCLLQLSRYAEAERLLQGVEADVPSERRLVRYSLGLACLGQNKDAEAEAHFTQLILEDAKSLPAYVQLAYLFDRLSRTAEVVPLLEKGVAQIPEAGELHLLLGAAYADGKEYLCAAEALRKGLSQVGESATLRYALAQSLDRAGDFEAALPELERVLALQPNHAEALNYLGYSLADKNQQIERAVEMLKQAVSLQPTNPYFLDSLGWAWFRMGDFERARYYLERSLSLMNREGPDVLAIREHLRFVNEAASAAASTQPPSASQENNKP